MTAYDDLAGKRALVTGASGDIGAAVVEAFLEHATDVVGVDMADAAIFNESYTHHKGSVADIKFVKDLFEGRGEETQPYDIVVNCAGITRDKSFNQLTDQDWEAVFDVSMRGTRYMSTFAVVDMIRNRTKGSIINFGSLAAYHGHRGQTAYAAAKGAVISYTHSLADEVSKKGIRVNSVSPGFIEGKMSQAVNQKIIDEYLEKAGLQALATPLDVAYEVLSLASDTCTITGKDHAVGWGKIEK